MADKKLEKKVDDLIINIKLSEDTEYKYVDIELGYQFDSIQEVDSIISAINGFISTHKKGLGHTSINILGYGYKD